MRAVRVLAMEDSRDHARLEGGLVRVRVRARARVRARVRARLGE